MISARWKYLLWGALFLVFFSSNQDSFAQCNPSSIELAGNGVDEDCDGLDGHFLHLPQYLYMVEGKSFELFFRNITLSTHPQDYVYEVVSPLNGQNMGQKWTFIPNSLHVGNHPLTVRIKHPFTGQVLATATTTVRVTSAASPSNVSAKKVVMMGHSMVDQGIMPNFLRKLCEEPGNPSVSFFGSRVSWIDNVTRHQGKGGASWRYFKDDPSSPFRFNGQLNMPQYFNENICQGCRPDVFIIHLGENDYLFQGQVNGSTLEEVRTYIDADYQQNVLPFINAVRAAAPNAKIGICFEIPGSGRPNAFPGFFGTSSVLGSHYRWRKIMNTILYKYSEKFGNREAENIYLLPIHTGVDDVNHFGDGDPVHPFPAGSMLNDPSGYPSMTTTIYAWMKYIFANTQGGGGGSPKIDLELTMTGNTPNPSIFSSFSTTTTIHNYSNTVATNVSVSIPLPAGVIIVNPAFQASQGTYSWYSDKKWIVGVLPAQGSASITVNYYMMTGQPLKFYAQVASADQSDVDSQPNNGDGFDTNEDDETAFVTNSGSSGGTTCDLELSIAGDAAQANAFSNFSTTLTLENKSNVAAQNVRVHVPRPQLTAYQGGNESSTNLGSFDALNDAWLVGHVGPNSSASLTVHYFTLTAGRLDFYAQVEGATPADSDSSPNNGNGQTESEDDEALFQLNAQNINCGIQANAVDVLCNNNGTNNNPNDDTFTFKLAVTGIPNNWVAHVNGQAINGSVSSNTSFGPYPVATGSVFLQVKDLNNLDCSIDLTVAPPTACSNGNTGNCTSQSDFPWHEWISRFQVGAFIKNSGKMGYSDYTNDIIDLARGQNATCSITATYSYFTHAEKVKIWIDYNQNGIFEEPSEIAYATTITPPGVGSDVSKTITGVWAVPWTAPDGLSRMRVSMQRSNFATACGNFTYGEVEDYTIRISALGQPTAPALQKGDALHYTEQGDALVYPNPSRKEAFVNLNDYIGNTVALRLVDGFGRVVWQEQLTASSAPIACPVSALPAGLYALHMEVENERGKVVQVVIQE